MGLLRSKSELVKIGFNHLLPLDSLLNLPSWHFPLLCQPMREHHCGLSSRRSKASDSEPLDSLPGARRCHLEESLPPAAGVRIPTRRDDRSVACTWLYLRS